MGSDFINPIIAYAIEIGTSPTDFDFVKMDLHEDRRHYTNYYYNADPSDLRLGLKHLKYTKGVLIPMTLLIPDRNQDNREDFVWCVPITRDKWTKWYKLSKKFKTQTPQHVRYITRMEGKETKTILLLPIDTQSNDDAMVACAWLRMVKGFTCRMYVVRCTDQSTSMAQLINQTAGIDPKLLHEIEDGEDPNKET